MSSESTSPTASPSTDDSSPPPPSSTSPPPPSTPSPPPPSTTSPPPPSPTATPPPSDSSSSSPPPPNSPPPAPPTSSPPPPSSTPPPATPDTSESPPPPASSASPSPPAATPSPPAPVDAAPLPDSPPTTPAFSPPQAQEKPVPASETPRPPSFSPNPTRSGAGSRSSQNSSSSGNQPSIGGGVIAGIVVGGVVIIALLIVIICLMCNKKKRKPQYYMDPGRQPNGTNQYYNQDPAQWHSSPAPAPPNQGGNGWGSTQMPHANTSGEFSSHPMPASANMGGIHQFSYEELASATGGFCEANLLGQGGFGLVHKGILPADRREVAVKSLKSGSGQGEREFQAEVEIISRVHHRHLVSLVGYCIAGDNKLLVYEYVANKTMEFHLHGKGQPVLDWPTRLRIAIGSAKGLAYLHEDCLPRIIHRDIKAANILIDNNYEAMVADFGLAKLTTDNNTHISTRVMGTFGYLAPEYASSGKLSEKSDVFSFGVMLLELVTGRRPIDLTNITMEDSLVDWARPLLAKALEDGNYEQLVDPGLQGKYLHHELARMAACAAASIRHSARKRPKMSQIVRALEGESSLEDLNEGVKPGQSAMHNPNGGGGTTELYDTRAYNADMMKFKKMVLSSESSEYGLNPSDADSMEMERRAFDANKS